MASFEVFDDVYKEEETSSPEGADWERAIERNTTQASATTASPAMSTPAPKSADI